MVVKLFKCILSSFRFLTAKITSDSLPTPDGSIRIRSGLNSSITFSIAFEKSPTRVQHMQPEFISLISMPASLRNPPSIPISPNSFSINTIFSPLYASSISFLISVVFPAPKNPEKISIFVISFFISIPPSQILYLYRKQNTTLSQNFSQ